MAANQAQAKANAAREQLMARASEQKYADGVDMSAGAVVSAQTAATNLQSAKRLCDKCGAELGSAKFCPECGTAGPAASPRFCSQCGTPNEGKAKFCPECGGKFS